MRGYDIGTSALQAHQKALAVHGNNIANSQTEGYHRQRALLVNRDPQQSGAHQLGAGVNVSEVQQLRDTVTEAAITRNNSTLSLVQSELDVASRLESLLTPGDSSVHAQLSGFFNGLERVSATPDERSVRSEFLSSGSALTRELNELASSLESLGRDLEGELTAGINTVNTLMKEIAELNVDIQRTRNFGSEPHDLIDRRDQSINRLSEWVEVRVERSSSSRDLVYVAGGAAIIADQAPTLAFIRDGENHFGIIREPSSVNLPLSSGRLKGLIDGLNETLPALRTDLDRLARELVRSVDQQHASGLNNPLGYAAIEGTRGVDGVNTPLQFAGTQFPVSAGDLSVSVTDVSTGLRTTHRVAIDPATDSLTDISTRLGAISGITTFVSLPDGLLNIVGENGHQLDFAGRLDQVPDLTSFAGTSQPRFSGAYSRETNDDWTVTFSGTGEIGVTNGLTATVRNADGELISQHNVGNGYEAGSDFVLADGVQLSFSSGTVLAADSFTQQLTGTPDETGILSALGLNSLFTGSTIGNFAIRQDIRENSNLLAVSRTGHVGESQNVAKLASLRDVRYASLDGRTFVETLADLTSDAGLDVREATGQRTQLEALLQRLETDRDSVSGVDPNEEVLKMMEIERAMQAAARFISSFDEMLGELLRIVD